MQVLTLPCLRSRRTFAAFTLVALCMAAALSLPSMASEKHLEKMGTTTKLTASAKAVKEFSFFSLTAKVSPSKATGTVAFYGSPGPGRPYIKLVTYKVVAGVAKAPALHLRISGHVTFKAVYSGSGVYNTSTSNVVPVDVTK
jgi:hypothetical protein